MDLDFSFALVSSLTPRRKVGKTPVTADTLKKTKSLKTKENTTSQAKVTEEIPQQSREEKENIIPEVQLMNKDVSRKLSKNQKNCNVSNDTSSQSCEDKLLSSFPVNMENIAVRKNRRRGKRQNETSPVCGNVITNSVEHFVSKSNVSSERLSFCTAEVINISSDHDNSCRKSQSYHNGEIRRTSSRLLMDSSNSMFCSIDVIESSCLEGNFGSIENYGSFDKSSKSPTKINQITKSTSARCSGLSETSLSTAYDSDSFHLTHRPGVKVIPETPDTDKSSRTSFTDKRKSSPIMGLASEENKQRKSDNFSKENTKKFSVKRKSSELSVTSEKNKLCNNSIESLSINLRPRKKSSSLSSSVEKIKPKDTFNCSKCFSENKDKFQDTIIVPFTEVLIPNCSNEVEVEPKKKLRCSDESSLIDMFKLESNIRVQPPTTVNAKEFETTKSDPVSKKYKKKTIISPLFKGSCTKGLHHGTFNSRKKKKSGGKSQIDMKNTSSQRVLVTNSKTSGRSNKIKLSVNSPLSPKTSTLVLPSEVIPKFEHINRWLEDTQEKTLGSLEYKSIAAGIASKEVVPLKLKYKVSLSPRIKKKKEKAKSSLEEEQKLFEELYGGDYENRLSNDIEDVASRSSCQDSVEFSENVLDKLYGTVWQKNTGVTKSEPRKTKKKSSKSKTPRTERKKLRTSIYEVFSSSSSEDRFEEFLENVQRGKMESINCRNECPGTPEFINDSESEDNASLVFYHNIVSSAVKEEVNNLKIKETKTDQGAHNVNRRRLSFGSSKDDYSESGRSDTKLSTKSKKSSTKGRKTKTRNIRSKKKDDKSNKVKSNDDIDAFSLITPFKIKSKTNENDLGERQTNADENEVHKSVGKSKTKNKSNKTKEIDNTEERLRATYLKEDNFKVPKANTYKTPSRTTKTDVPASPALSFLSSLSEMTAGLPCHPDAIIFKKQFKSKREELTKKLFVLYNKEVFDYQLPAEMLIQWSSRMTSTSGYCYNKRIYKDNQILRSSRIVLSTKILDRADRLRDTLIHELCHAATWIVNATSDGHGPIWKSWADKANRRFPELPVIKRCHDYAISTKFTYKCMSCGYSIGRHTKSLDTERKRCGFCFGKFQVFVTAKMSSASVTSGSDSVRTPRNPTGFALFVKENYALVKKENNVPHAQVMKLLSQKFAEVKISKQNNDEPIVVE